LAATLRLHPLGFWASTSCAVSMISTTTTPTSPKAVTSAKSTIAVCVSTDLKILEEIYKNDQRNCKKYAVYGILIFLFSIIGDSL
jgi:hypothetical protein